MRMSGPIIVMALALAAPMATAATRDAGYLPVHVSAENRTGGPLECQAVAGHWYSFDLGTGAAGSRLGFDMVVEPKSGTVAMYNSQKDPVPIETVFCGVAGKAWDTRFVFPLRSIASKAAGGQGSDFVCGAEGDAVTCR